LTGLYDPSADPLDYRNADSIPHHPVSRRVGEFTTVRSPSRPVVREALEPFAFAGSEAADTECSGYVRLAVGVCTAFAGCQGVGYFFRLSATVAGDSGLECNRWNLRNMYGIRPVVLTANEYLAAARLPIET